MGVKNNLGVATLLSISLLSQVSCEVKPLSSKRNRGYEKRETRKAKMDSIKSIHTKVDNAVKVTIQQLRSEGLIVD
jgi:hypothetical protein